MLKRWLRAWLSQPQQEPSRSEVVERIDVCERKVKRLEAEMDAELEKVRALNARMTRLLERRERAPQEAPGSTIDTPEGVTPPGQGPREDLYTQAARLKKVHEQQARAFTRAG